MKLFTDLVSKFKIEKPVRIPKPRKVRDMPVQRQLSQRLAKFKAAPLIASCLTELALSDGLLKAEKRTCACKSVPRMTEEKKWNKGWEKEMKNILHSARLLQRDGSHPGGERLVYHLSFRASGSRCRHTRPLGWALNQSATCQKCHDQPDKSSGPKK